MHLQKGKPQLALMGGDGQQLRALAAAVEDWSSVPSTHRAAHDHL